MESSRSLNRTEPELLAAAQTGDREALEALLSAHQARIRRFGLRMCGHAEDAEDVVQETMLAAARHLPSFRGNASISTWLFRIARSFCTKVRRRSRFAPPPETVEDVHAVGDRLPDEARTPHEHLEGRELERALSAAIGALAPMYREVLLLRDVEGLTAPEVAETLGLQVATVKTRLHRARASVRERLTPLMEPTPPRRCARCRDLVTLYSRNLEGDLPAGTCAQMEAHLRDCPECQAACADMQKLLAMCRAG